MLSVTGVGRKEYGEKLGRGGAVPSVACPGAACEGQEQGGHGFYRRYVDEKLFEVRRLICGLCGVSNALLPADICAYRDVSIWLWKRRRMRGRARQPRCGPHR